MGHGGPYSPGLPELERGAQTAARGMAVDVVEGAADRARAALDAVAGADQCLLLLLIPFVYPGGTEVGAVLANALGGADGLVDDLDVGTPRVLVVLDREELVSELFHDLTRSEAFPHPAHQTNCIAVVRGMDVLVGRVNPIVRAARSE